MGVYTGAHTLRILSSGLWGQANKLWHDQNSQIGQLNRESGLPGCQFSWIL